MATITHSSSTQDAAEILRLMETAQQVGKPDRYNGKRRWTRLTVGMKLEITTDPADPSGSHHVTMQNLSGGGFSFWSKRGLVAHSSIFVREYSDEGQHEWVPAHVCHCTVGIRGFLVGAEFENPPPPDESPACGER